MTRIIVVLIALSWLACSPQPPTAHQAQAEAVAIGEVVSINGAPYRRVAAKPTATQTDYSLTITIPLSTSEDGTLLLQDSIMVAGVVYRSSCEAAPAQDDVGNTIGTATELTVPTPTSQTEGAFWTSPTYQLTTGDVDYFMLRVSETCDLGVMSGPDGNTTDTVGKLVTRSERVIDENDNSECCAPLFLVWAIGVSPGVLFLEVRGATPNTAGPYSLLVGTWHTGAAKAATEGGRAWRR